MEVDYKVLYIIAYTYSDIDRTRNSFRRKEFKARNTSYYIAINYTKLYIALSRADIPYLYSRPRSVCSCR